MALFRSAFFLQKERRRCDVPGLRRGLRYTKVSIIGSVYTLLQVGVYRDLIHSYMYQKLDRMQHVFRHFLHKRTRFLIQRGISGKFREISGFPERFLDSQRDFWISFWDFKFSRKISGISLGIRDFQWATVVRGHPTSPMVQACMEKIHQKTVTGLRILHVPE